MTDRSLTDQFETRFAARVRTYTDPAAARNIDPLAVSRAAMAAQRARSRLAIVREVGRGRSTIDLRWAAVVAIVIIGVATMAVATLLPRADVAQRPTKGPTSTPGSGSLPAALLHEWQRPYAVTPDQAQWPSGSLIIAEGRVEFSALDGPVSSATIVVAGVDSFVATGTVESPGCVADGAGTYRWLLEGKDTVLTVTPIGADACAARENALVGQWVRTDFPPRSDPMKPGAHKTSVFDPLGERSRVGALVYTVPEGWATIDDSVGTFVIRHQPDGPPLQTPPDLMIALLAQPRLAADFTEGQACGPVSEEPDAGRSVDDLVAAITSRAGVVATRPVAVSIGGYSGQLFDIHIAEDWKGGCVAEADRVISKPILVGPSSSPEGGVLTAVGRDHPVRILLLDLGAGRSLGVVVFDPQSSTSAEFEEIVAQAMPIIESFEFKPDTP
jgi:hypothetical protein